MCVVLPCCETKTKNYVFFVSFLLVLSHSRSFYWFFTIFLGHQNPGPGYYYINLHDSWNLNVIQDYKCITEFLIFTVMKTSTYYKLGLTSTDNGAIDSENLLLKTQLGEDFA